MMSPEAAAAAEAVAEEHHPVHSIVYGPLNALWDWFVAATGQEARWGHVEVPEHVAMSIFVMLLCAAIFIPMRFLLKKDRPGRLQQIVELTVEGLAGLVEDVVGHGAARRYVPMIGALALFILIANLTGLFFFLQPPTQNPNTTFALSITAWLYYNYVGVRRHGFGYFKQFLGPVLGCSCCSCRSRSSATWPERSRSACVFSGTSTASTRSPRSSSASRRSSCRSR